MLRTFALTALLLGVCAVPASAGTMSSPEGRLVFIAGDGETNNVTMTMMDTGPVIVRDSTASLTGCGPFSHPEVPELPDDLMCIGGSPKVTLGDGDDAVYVADAGTEMPIGTTEADGGAGDDSLRTGISDDVLRGGPGDDDLWAGVHGNDTLDGGPGEDTLDGLWGDDTFSARDGEKDTVRCGEGTDTVTADRVDVLVECETVDLPPLTGGPHPPPVDRTGETGTGSTTTADAGPRGQISAYPDLSGRDRTVPDVARRDRTAPKLRVSAKGRTLTLRADEACSVTLRAGKRTITRPLKPGKAVKVRVPGTAKRVRLTARDASGNVAAVSRKVR